MNKKNSIFILDDDVAILENLRDILSEDDYIVEGNVTIASAKKELEKKSYDLYLLDIKLPDGTGLEFLKEIKKINPEAMVILTTGFASVESAITAMNDGAFAYIQKPINIDELRLTIKKALKMRSLSIDNKNLVNELKELSIKDPLTGLFNYRYFKERLSAEFKRADRYAISISLIMVDLDYFKSINDIYGHPYGDNILKEVSGHLLISARKTDVVARYGGEEFMILMPDTGTDGAAAFGKKLLDSLNSHVFDPEGKKIGLKASVGIVSYPGAGLRSESDLLNSVDKAMRQAKEEGGNKLVVFHGTEKQEEEKIVDKDGRGNVDKIKQKLVKIADRANRTLLESIYGFAKTITAKDHYPAQHAENMASLATEIGKKLGLPPSTIEDVEQAAILHDLGKIAIPDNILQKKGKLTKKEFEKLKKHPQIGAEIIRNIYFLDKVMPIVLYHHERFDGSGYLSGLKAKEIPMEARIVAVADVYNALISDRPYRKAYSKEEALKLTQEGSGTQFDPQVVQALSEVVQ